MAKPRVAGKSLSLRIVRIGEWEMKFHVVTTDGEIETE